MLKKPEKKIKYKETTRKNKKVNMFVKKVQCSIKFEKDTINFSQHTTVTNGDLQKKFLTQDKKTKSF